MQGQLLRPLLACLAELCAALLHSLLKRLENGGLVPEVLRLLLAREREQFFKHSLLAVASDVMDITQQILSAFRIMLHMSQEIAGRRRCRCAGGDVGNGTFIL